MNFRAFLALLSLSAMILPLGGQETLSTAPNGTSSVIQTLESPARSNSSAAQISSSTATTTAVSASSLKLTEPALLLNGLTNGTVSVIVTLVPPPAALGKKDFNSKTFLATLQTQNKAVQNNVLATVSDQDVKVRFRFDNLAGFSAEVTAAGLKALQANPQVALIEPVHTLEAHLAQGIPLIHGMTYRSTYNGAGVAIAICDTGIDYNHTMLGGGGFPNSKVLGGYDFGDNDADPIPNAQAHGTCCAGIAAGSLGNVGDYIGGVAYNAKLYALKISSGASGSASTAAMVAAWDWCVTHKNDNTNYPIMVISTSFGGGRYFSSCDSDTPAMTAAANNAVAAGITVLASSGNDGYCDSIAWPACISSVISVGAVYDAGFGTFLPCVNSDSCAPKTANAGCSTGYYATDSTAADKVTSYANMASFVTLLAPGNQCYTLDISGPSGYSSGDFYDSFGGTSAACPYAAGAAACLQSAAKAVTGNFLTPQEVRDLLVNYGDGVTDTKVAITKPRVNLERAIQSLDTIALVALNGGNGDQTVEPDECNDLTITIRNDGPSLATNISATIATTTPGVTLLQISSAYPDLAAGGTGTNTTPFKISTGPDFECGTLVNLTLIINWDGNMRTNSCQLSSGSTNYGLTASIGTIVPGVTDVGNHGDDTIITIDLPFPYTFYGQTFSNAALSSNGNLQFASSNNSYSNSCPPYVGFNYAILPLWDDLRTDGADSGIFISTNGSAPDRIFNLEWRTTYFTNGASANFEVRLYENQPRFDMIYGALNGNGSAATVGAQKDMGSRFTQFGCNSGVLSNGLQLTYQITCTPGGGKCLTTTADFFADQTNGFAPLTVNFTSLSTAATNFAWDFGDGNTSTNINPSEAYTNPGVYSVTLTVIGAYGTNSLTRANYIVAAAPPPAANFAANFTNGILPLAVVFTNLSTTATNFAWDFGDGNTSTDLNPANVYVVAGLYTVSLTAIGPGGTNQLVRADYILVKEPPPVADFVADVTSGTSPLTVNFNNLSSGATTYYWNFGDGNSSADSAPQDTFANAGVYTVTLTAIGPGGTNQLVRTGYIVVTNPPPVVVNFAASPTNGVAPLTVYFTNFTSGATTYSWDFGDGNWSGDLNPQNTFANAGTYTVTLTAAGPGGTSSLVLTNFIAVLNPPLLVINPATLDFGLVVTGATAQASLVVSNAGDIPLDATASVDHEPFAIVDFSNGTISNLTFSVAGSSSTNINLRFAPILEGAFTNTIVFSGNGGDATNQITGRSVGTVLIGRTLLSETNFTFSFPTVPGINYFVEYKDSLPDPDWQPLQSLPGDGSVLTITNSIPATSQRFFRISAQ